MSYSGSRVKSERSETSVNFSGDLGPRLAWHAAERCKRLFLFLFAVDAACRRVADLTGGKTIIKPLSVIREKATHQVDTGMRSKDDAYLEFDTEDTNMTSASSTEFGKTDAAHYCNLGLTGSWATIMGMVDAAKDKALAQLVDLATKCAGDTVQLPQRINIGPDRIIDQFHFVAATAIYKAGTPVCSQANILAYGKGATDAMNAYIATKQSEGDVGLSKCAACYLEAYSNKALEQIYLSIAGNIAAECDALGLKTADYAV